MQKPSERIRDLATENGIPYHEAVPAWIIAGYLDEQWEKNQPCQHEETEDAYGGKMCKKCHLLGNF